MGMQCAPILSGCFLQACEQLDDHLDTLAHRYLGTVFLRTRMSRHSPLPAVLGLSHAPGEPLMEFKQSLFLMPKQHSSFHGCLNHLLCSCAMPGSLDLFRLEQVAPVWVFADDPTLMAAKSLLCSCAGLGPHS